LKFTDMSTKQWVDFELSRQEKLVEEIADLPWEEYVDKQKELIDHIAKAQVLRTVQKKLNEEAK